MPHDNEYAEEFQESKNGRIDTLLCRQTREDSSHSKHPNQFETTQQTEDLVEACSRQIDVVHPHDEVDGNTSNEVNNEPLFCISSRYGLHICLVGADIGTTFDFKRREEIHDNIWGTELVSVYQFSTQPDPNSFVNRFSPVMNKALKSISTQSASPTPSNPMLTGVMTA